MFLVYTYSYCRVGIFVCRADAFSHDFNGSAVLRGCAMTFTTFRFVIFFIILFGVYWAIPPKARWICLLVSDTVFYAFAGIPYLMLLVFSIIWSYFLGLWIDGAGTVSARRRRVIPGICTAVLVLSFFKYGTNLLNAASSLTFIPKALRMSAQTARIAMPLGISFYTFQIIGYLADLCEMRIHAERHLGYYALFVSFFPQIVSGPIGRAGKLLPQFREEHHFSYERASVGIRLIVWGCFKKLVIANTLADRVDQYFGHLHSYVGFILAVSVIMYAFQIYCDFSGYTDIAVGCASLLGIDLPENFNCPYFSRSPKEFWSRWHISLSTWLRDYIYIPLGGSRKGTLRTYVNIMVTFIISGLWHGTGITFMIWGLLHGLYQVIARFFSRIFHISRNPRPSAPVRFLEWAATFACVCFAWLFFRADSLSDALYVISKIPFGISDPVNYIKTAVISSGMTYVHMAVIAGELLILFIADRMTLDGRSPMKYVSGLRPALRYCLYALFLVLILIFSEKGVSTGFIYAQF